MVNEIFMLAGCLLAGVLLGAIFFGGLWWTVQKAISSKWAALWFLSSLLVRTSAILAGFYFIGRDHWERISICLLGFIIARSAVIWLTKERQKPACLLQEDSRAP